MNNRERISATLMGKPSDRTPVLNVLGLWEETAERWEQEGMPVGVDTSEYFGFDAGFRYISDFTCGVRLGINPWFVTEVLEEKERSVISRDNYGIVKEYFKNGTGTSIPRFIEYPVKDWESWKRLKESKLAPDLPARIPENFGQTAEMYNSGEEFVILGDYPYGLFGTARDLMGVEEFMVACALEPDLVADIMDHMTTLWLSVYEKVVKHVRVDCIHMWEDMSGKQGSLISPDMVREFMLPNYKRIHDFCIEQNIPIFSVDTDGRVDDLIRLFMESGVNFMLPFEVAAGCDVLEYRKQYPGLAMMGGIDKREIAKTKKDIDKQLRLAADMIAYGRYIPALDHAAHPEISLENFKYFVGGLIEICGKKR